MTDHGRGDGARPRKKHCVVHTGIDSAHVSCSSKISLARDIHPANVGVGSWLKLFVSRRRNKVINTIHFATLLCPLFQRQDFFGSR